jgi:dTDP-glucose 4,6-dehydratase
MRILITGGAGFLGSHFCDRLIRERHSVICMDNLITGTLDNIAHLMENKDFKFVRQNVTEYIEIDEQIDYVLHFASPASPIDYQKYPIQTLKVGALGTHKTLGLAKAKKAKFLLASTSEVYGDPLINPQREDYRGNVNATGPRGMYDEAKRFAEALTMAYHRYHGMDTRIARIFNTFGERMRKKDGRVVPTFIGQALANEPLTVFGDGSQTRSFCYVSDMIEGIYKLMLSDVSEPVNLGNPQEMSIIDFAKKIIELTQSKGKIVYKPLPKDDPKVRRPDISKAKKLLTWEPKISLEKGLKRTIAWFATAKTQKTIAKTQKS